MIWRKKIVVTSTSDEQPDIRGMVVSLVEKFREVGASPYDAATVAIGLVIEDLWMSYTLLTVDHVLRERLERLDSLIATTEKILATTKQRVRLLGWMMWLWLAYAVALYFLLR